MGDLLLRTRMIALSIACLFVGLVVGLILGVWRAEERSTSSRNTAEDAAALREAFAEFESAPAASTPLLEALEAARVEAAAALEALREAAAEDLQVELGRIATAAEAEAVEARAQLSDFRGQIVAYGERHRAEQQLPSDSLEATLAAHRERSMLREIDFAISSVGLNVEMARLAAENAARDAADDRLNKVTDDYYVCMALEEDSGASVGGVAACGALLVLGPPEWPTHDWGCVHRAVNAVVSMRPDNYTPFAPDAVEAQIGRIFACTGLELG